MLQDLPVSPQTQLCLLAIVAQQSFTQRYSVRRAQHFLTRMTSKFIDETNKITNVFAAADSQSLGHPNTGKIKFSIQFPVASEPSPLFAGDHFISNGNWIICWRWLFLAIGINNLKVSKMRAGKTTASVSWQMTNGDGERNSRNGIYKKNSFQ